MEKGLVPSLVVVVVDLSSSPAVSEDDSNVANALSDDISFLTLLGSSTTTEGVDDRAVYSMLSLFSLSEENIPCRLRIRSSRALLLLHSLMIYRHPNWSPMLRALSLQQSRLNLPYAVS